MSGECVFDLVVPSEDKAAQDGVGATTPHATGRRARKLPPPTASTFGIHGTSAVMANMGGEYSDVVTVYPAKKATGILGREVAPSIDPSNFLRKNEGVFTASRGNAVVDGSCFEKSEHHSEKIKPDVPTRDERPIMGLKTKKNYVLANAVENSMAVVARPLPATEPRPTERDDFGQVPQYLSEIKDELKQRRELIDTYDRQVREANERWSQLSDAELGELREGLQRRWDAVNSEYQSKGFSKLQTPSQKLHQEGLEKELSAIEFALQKISRKCVFVYDDGK